MEENKCTENVGMMRTMKPPRHEDGWLGAFTREQVPGAWPNGTRVVKVIAEEGDGHQLGEMATVLGSLSHPDIYDGKPCYFLEWDGHPRVAVACLGWKLAPVQ